ncbi:hypothetical protein ACFXOS_19845 [Streptomyces sp. NPDC059175]|uniref:hypothetical protein n=1 Tax=Streptomyces sp. NPDC059175 TaxID=3346757 RepID=UPI00368C64F9
MAGGSSADRRSRKSSEKAAALAGTSGRTVEKTKTVKRYAPHLLPKIVAGEMSVSAAYEEARRLAIEARAADVDLGPYSRIGGRVDPQDTDPCPHCHGSGRIPKEIN